MASPVIAIDESRIPDVWPCQCCGGGGRLLRGGILNPPIYIEICAVCEGKGLYNENAVSVQYTAFTVHWYDKTNGNFLDYSNF